MRFIQWRLQGYRLLTSRVFNLQNEKRKDKEVTARIERIFKLRDQAMKGVDVGARTTFIYALGWG
jgi:hypothetical protein